MQTTNHLNSIPHHAKVSHMLILEYTSYVEKDIQTSVELTDLFINRLRRWLLSRCCHMGLNSQPALWAFAQALPAHKAQRNSVKPRKLFTVIRSPFVYKKTREQFGLNKRTYSLRLRLTKTQQNVLLQWLCQLKLPAELKLKFQ